MFFFVCERSNWFLATSELEDLYKCRIGRSFIDFFFSKIDLLRNNLDAGMRDESIFSSTLLKRHFLNSNYGSSDYFIITLWCGPAVPAKKTTRRDL